jgi:hypothetical protein
MAAKPMPDSFGTNENATAPILGTKQMLGRVNTDAAKYASQAGKLGWHRDQRPGIRLSAPGSAHTRDEVADDRQIREVKHHTNVKRWRI